MEAAPGRDVLCKLVFVCCTEDSCVCCTQEFRKRRIGDDGQCTLRILSVCTEAVQKSGWYHGVVSSLFLEGRFLFDRNLLLNKKALRAGSQNSNIPIVGYAYSGLRADMKGDIYERETSGN